MSEDDIPLSEAQRRREANRAFAIASGQMLDDRRPRAGRKHSPFMHGGRPLDLQPLPVIDPLRWEGKPIPERRWIVPGIVPEGNVTLLAGDGGEGKTLLVMQLLVACALGKTWLGNSVRPCKTLGVFCEDDGDELHRRIGDILRHYDATFADLENLTLLSRVGEDNQLVSFADQWNEGEPTGFYTRVQELAISTGAELIVLDSLHDLFAGNENSRSHARQFIGELRTIAMQTRGAVLLTAHPSLSGRSSGTGEAGSTAWNNAVRSRLYLSSPRQEDGADRDRSSRRLATKKANYGPNGETIKLRWQDGVFVREDAPTGALGSIERRSADSAFLACLDALALQGRRVNDSKMQANYAPKTMAAMPEAERYNASDLAGAMNRLFSAGRIRIEEVGPPSHRRRHIARSTAAERDEGGEEA